MLKHFLFFYTVMAAFLITARNDAEYSPYDNSIYIAEAYGNNRRYITIDNEGAESAISARLAQIARTAVKVTISINDKALERFNQKNHTNYKSLPANCYTISAEQIEIPEGKVSSEPIKIKINATALESLKGEEQYAIAATIINYSPQDIHLMDNMKTCVFVCEKTKTETKN